MTEPVTDAVGALPTVRSILNQMIQHRHPEITQKPLPPLFHYTTSNNLLRIIESSTLWATQASCMNDAQELIHAVRLLRKALTKRLSNNPSAICRPMLEYAEWECRDTTDVVAAGYFVTCFSERGNDLSQWRAYGGNYGGVSIKFDGPQLASQANGGWLFPVIYKPSFKAQLMDFIVSEMENKFPPFVEKQAPGTDKTQIEKQYVSEWLKPWRYLLRLLNTTRSGMKPSGVWFL